MGNFTWLPGSIAVDSIDALLADKKFNYTSMAVSDEMALYNAINVRLIELEKALEIDTAVLQSIIEDTSKMMIQLDEKEELLLRINWLERLLKVEQEIDGVKTHRQANELHRYIFNCQTSPLKKQLQDRLEELLEILPQEVIEQTVTEKLMEFAIENAGNDFINLGKAGREDIVNRLFEQFGEDVPVKKIQDEVVALEERVARLTEINDVEELQAQLEVLPLSNYPSLSDERKQMVAEELIEFRQWKGLALLDRLIHQLDAKLNATEEKEMIQEIESGIAAVLDLDQLESLAIQKR